MSSPFDPTAPLPPARDPWVASSMPSLRDGPPYHMTDMIAAEPFLARRLLGRLLDGESEAARLATEIRRAIEGAGVILVTGCGTSEHAAVGTTDILRAAVRDAGVDRARWRISTEQAFETSLSPEHARLVVAISHEGGTTATNAALEAAKRAGTATALVTATGRSPGGALADIVVETLEMDESWCHTIGYLSPLLVATAVGAHLAGWTIDADAAGGLIAGGTDGSAADGIAPTLADASRLIVVASGSDRAAGRELVLKVEEASWLPSAYRDLETFLHGHLPATGADTGLVLLLTDRDARTERANRARDVLAASRVLGLRAAAILAQGVSAELEEALTPAGRIVVPDAPALPAPVASLLGSAGALQVLTERIARARRTNPDPIRRDDERYRRAAEAAEGGQTDDAPPAAPDTAM